MLFCICVPLQRFRVNLRPNDKWGPQKKDDVDDNKYNEIIKSVVNNGPEARAAQDEVKGVENKAFEHTDTKPPFLYFTKL